ncbi:MAG: hypothetical protein ACXV5S_03265, partial [Acidimicrobiales bacterium]
MTSSRRPDRPAVSDDLADLEDLEISENRTAPANEVTPRARRAERRAAPAAAVEAATDHERKQSSMTEIPSPSTQPTPRARRPRRMTRLLPIGFGLGALALLAAGCVTATSVANDTLTITGSGGADTIVLRLKAGDPNTVEV